MYAKINVFDPKSGYFAVENSNTELTEEDIAEAAKKIVDGFFEEYHKSNNSSPHATLSIEGQFIPELVDWILVKMDTNNVKILYSNINISIGYYNDHPFEDNIKEYDIYTDIKDHFWLEISIPVNRKEVVNGLDIEKFLKGYNKENLASNGEGGTCLCFETNDAMPSFIINKIRNVLKYNSISVFREEKIWSVMIDNPEWKENKE